MRLKIIRHLLEIRKILRLALKKWTDIIRGVWQAAGKIPKFTIKNGSYTVNQGRGGKIGYANGIITFTGGEFDGWKAVSDILKDGSYTILFRIDHYKTLPFGTAARIGDEQCYRQIADK